MENAAAHAFAKQWIAAWKHRDLEALLKHYPELSKIADPLYDDTANPDLPLLA